MKSDEDQKPEVRREASTLSSNIIKIENCYMAVLRNTILNRFESTSQYLQKVDVDLLTASRMLDSLVVFVQNLLEKFNEFEAKAKQLGDIEKSDYADTRRRKIKKRLADGSTQSSTLSGPDKFRIKSFYPIIDRLVSELKHRSEAYAYITKLFGFLQRLLTISDTELAEKCIELVKTYSNDLNENLLNEVRQFIPLLREQPREKFIEVDTSEIQEKNLNLLKVLEWMIQFDAQQVFPNLYIALRLLLTILIANCETERSFSVLKRIKNMYRSTMLDDRLSSLTIMSIEKEILRSLNFDGIIDNFARAKARKKYF
uniref:HAT C-terminal dimerisation domain-containing protein n=1 Tax=Trichogramma kaykai TaxID=54128 RepID=A0ABD2W6P2_9HYME